MDKLTFSFVALFFTLAQLPTLAIAEEDAGTEESKPSTEGEKPADEGAGKDGEKKGEEEPDC